jgi:hypothetical protein
MGVVTVVVTIGHRVPNNAAHHRADGSAHDRPRNRAADQAGLVRHGRNGEGQRSENDAGYENVLLHDEYPFGENRRRYSAVDLKWFRIGFL